MLVRDSEFWRGCAALRRALEQALDPLCLHAAGHPIGPMNRPALAADAWLLSEALDYTPPGFGPEGAPKASGRQPGPVGGQFSDADLACSSESDEADASRLIALVELARNGDSEAFGMLYDHYNASVYRFIYYRVGSVALAEDLMSETFFRALRSMGSFRWQGKDFGAWLMTIARNLTADHYKSGRTRLEHTTEDMSPHDSATEGPESTVLASLTNQSLLQALGNLPKEQHECLVMRFLQGLSIAETAKVLGRSDGAVKQLQLRAIRNLAKLLPEDLR